MKPWNILFYIKYKDRFLVKLEKVMKKRIVSYFLLLWALLLTTSCLFGPDIVLNKNIKIKVGERLSAENGVWIQLDSITQDTRNYYTNTPGRVVAEFTVGQDTSGVESWKQRLTFVTDTMDTRTFDSYWQGAIGEGNFYIMTITGVSPQRMGDVEIPNKDYIISFVLEEGMLAYKPNIYLYPKRKTKMSISLNFPQGGRVIKSDPAYPKAWQDISVKPNGRIDEKYDYLFYEASLPVKWQYNEGWSVLGKDLECFFLKNLSDYGFNDSEILDFVDYWVPKLIDFPYYNIYPQYTDKIDEVVELNISKNPKSVLRMFYVIEPVMSPKKTNISPPQIPAFVRKGFTVTEWGVVFK